MQFRYAFKILLGLIVGWFLYTLLSSKAYVSAGVVSWAIYGGFTALCAWALLCRPHYRTWQYITFLVPILICAYLVDITTWVNGSEFKTIQVAESIQQKCNTEGRCPSEIPGWDKINDNHFRDGQLNYYTGKFVEDDTVFTLFYHFGPDWDIWVKGGKGKELTVSYGE